MKAIDLDITKIIPYERNPRKNENAVDAVAKSIKEYGFKVPLVLTPDNVVITGHTRLEAAKRLGLKTVPVIYADKLDEMQVKAFRLADNKTGEIASWNLEKLEAELDEIDDEYIDRLFEKEFEGKELPEDAGKESEIDLGDYDDDSFEYECDECGFRFNA